MTDDLARFSINQMTVKQLSLPELVEACGDLGIRNVGLWREPVQAYGLEATAKLVRDAGLTVTTLCRGGFLTALGPKERDAALADNRRAVEEAAVLGTDTWRMAGTASKPIITGMTRSMKIISGGDWRACSTASWPFSATLTSKPSGSSRLSSTSRFSRRSSTTRMRRRGPA